VLTRTVLRQALAVFQAFSLAKPRILKSMEYKIAFSENSTGVSSGSLKTEFLEVP
jgi:hypothetical protein